MTTENQTLPPPVELAEQTTEIVAQVNEYGSMIVNGLYLVLAGMLIIYLLYKVATKFLYPHLRDTRLIKVVFGTLYVLVLVVTALLAFKQMGFDVSAISRLALTCVLIGAVVVFFLVPFFPSLPFKKGHLVELKGELGIVDSISAFHTSLRKLDGTMVFIPNALIMASPISNYSHTPHRRIEMTLSVNTDCDLEASKNLLLDRMTRDDRVLDDPAPAVYLFEATAAGVDMLAFCWVKNEHWFSARSDLWQDIVAECLDNEGVTLSLPQQEVHVINTPSAS